MALISDWTGYVEATTSAGYSPSDWTGYAEATTSAGYSPSDWTGYAEATTWRTPWRLVTSGGFEELIPHIIS